MCGSCVVFHSETALLPKITQNSLMIKYRKKYFKSYEKQYKQLSD